MDRRGAICIFVKSPQPGRVKTRLSPAIGAEAAAEVARASFRDTLAAVRALSWARIVVAADGPVQDLLDGDRAVAVWPQGEGDLGERIERVLLRALATNPFAMALGADTPGLPRRLIEAARVALRRSEAVLGPCEDGGFYLLGLRKCHRGLLARIPWGDRMTCACTRERLTRRGIRTSVLAKWFDMDRPGDLDRIQKLAEQGGLDAPETVRAILRCGPRRQEAVTR